MRTTIEPVGSVLTRTSGFLKTVCSHSLQPYRGCPFGKSLCGVGCYVRHNPYVTRGREWGTFLEVRAEASVAYRSGYRRERAWAQKSRGRFSVFLSSSTEPFPPQETRFGVTRAVLEAMVELPPDELIVQTHSHRVAEAADVLQEVASRSDLRVHVSIETDLERFPGLPPHASPVEARFRAARSLKASGLRVIVTVSPLLPIGDPDRFFARVAEVADGVVLDHFIGGDGSPEGSRTRRTALPTAMQAVEPGSVALDYRERMGDVAQRYLPGRVGFHIDGFAGRWAAV
jgi:DNA repair photolyase